MVGRASATSSSPSWTTTPPQGHLHTTAEQLRDGAAGVAATRAAALIAELL